LLLIAVAGFAVLVAVAFDIIALLLQ
jgi:hypothetical protein